MKFPLKLAAIGAGALLALAPLSALAQSEPFNDTQKKAIQQIIKDYLISNPEVMLEVQEAYEKKMEAKRGEAMTTRMPDFYKELDGMKADLAGFTVGDGEATLIEFFDYNCGFCQRTLPEIVKLVNTDKHFKMLFLEFPILSQGSREASKVAVAAAKQGKYYEFYQAMLGSGHATKESALKAAEKLGLDMKKLKEDMERPETDAFLTKISDIGRRLTIDGTPSFIAGDKTNPGAADAEQLEALIEAERKEGCKACVKAANAAKDEKKS
jgi:protein-disulfide isomerase